MLWHLNARVNSHQRWKQTWFRVCVHLWCELTSTMKVTEWQVSWSSSEVDLFFWNGYILQYNHDVLFFFTDLSWNCNETSKRGTKGNGNCGNGNYGNWNSGKRWNRKSRWNHLVRWEKRKRNGWKRVDGYLVASSMLLPCLAVRTSQCKSDVNLYHPSIYVALTFFVLCPTPNGPLRCWWNTK